MALPQNRRTNRDQIPCAEDLEALALSAGDPATTSSSQHAAFSGPTKVLVSHELQKVIGAKTEYSLEDLPGEVMLELLIQLGHAQIVEQAEPAPDQQRPTVQCEGTTQSGARDSATSEMDASRSHE